jgi:putative oxygen-independent coproporphyrinogen III oxidase
MTSLAAGPEPTELERRRALIPAVSLYIHVPFCVSKCAYCDFCSTTLARAERELLLARGTDSRRAPADPAVAFVDAVLRATDLAVRDVLTDVPTLYFGGGTPTVLGEELVRLVQGVRERANLRAGAEITVETNPETTDPALIAALTASGVNRFSLGVQSFDDDVLVTLGRVHDAVRALRACETLAASGVPFSIDLMCGIPGQTMGSWTDTLEKALAVGAGHFSVYPLALEDSTPLADDVAEERVPAPDPDTAADMMLLAARMMAERGIERYETANHARPGSESRHNLVYWTGGAYLGFGPSAASMMPSYATIGLEPQRVWGPDYAECMTGDEWREGRDRFTVNETLVDFVERGWDRYPALREHLSDVDSRREDIMLGLRVSTGVRASAVEAAHLHEVMERLARQRLVERYRTAEGEDRWRTTQRGWLLGNEVFGAVWAGE